MSKDVATNTTKSLLQRFAIKSLKAKVASKLVKDVSKSALRKYAKTASTSITAFKISKTIAKATFFDHVAVFLVEEAFELAFYLMSSDEPAKKDKALKALTKKSKENFARLLGAAALGTAGGAVGTLIQPGKGTYWGTFIGGTILYLV
eukprot:Colp12_sorted_trinity150504_noHs@2196